MTGPRVAVTDLVKVYRSRAHPEGLLALDGVGFTAAEGEFLCLLGPSGCGKSTVLSILAGLDRDFGGRVNVDRDLRLAFVFQDPRLLPWLTVRQNLLFALETSRAPREEWGRGASRWLERVGLAAFGDAHPHELSGGMQQRAAVARAFAVDPDVLLMDEPFTGLDELTARSMRQELVQLWEQTRKTILFVTHNCFEACFLADRVLVMTPRPGRIRADLPVDVPRPRDQDSAALFSRSVELTRLVLDM